MSNYRRDGFDWQSLVGRTITAVELVENLEDRRDIDGYDPGGVYSRLTLTFADGGQIALVTMDAEQYWSGLATAEVDPAADTSDTGGMP